MAPKLSPICSRLVAELSGVVPATDSLAMSMRRLVPISEPKSRIILNKNLLMSAKLTEASSYNDLIHLKHRLEYVEESLKLLRQSVTDMPQDQIASEISNLEDCKRKLLFQKACLKSIKYRLVPRLAEANHTAVKSSGLLERASHQIEETEILAYIRSRPELEHDLGWQRIIELLEQLTFEVLEFSTVFSQAVETYYLDDLRAIYYARFCPDKEAQVNFVSQVLKDVKILCDPSNDPRTVETIITPQFEKEWPGNLFTYWELLAINGGQELARLNHFDIVRVTETSCENYLYNIGRHSESVEETIKPGLEKADPNIDPYWLPFVLLRHRVISLKDLVELYVKVAMSLLTDMSPPTALRGCYLIRVQNNLFNLGYYLVDKVQDRKSLCLDASVLSISQNKSSLQSSLIKAPTGEEKAKLTATLLRSISEVCNRVNAALESQRAELAHLKMYPTTLRRHQTVESDIKSLNIEKSLATFNSRLF